jgi:hypothetical protein
MCIKSKEYILELHAELPHSLNFVFNQMKRNLSLYCPADPIQIREFTDQGSD